MVLTACGFVVPGFNGLNDSSSTRDLMFFAPCHSVRSSQAIALYSGLRQRVQGVRLPASRTPRKQEPWALRKSVTVPGKIEVPQTLNPLLCQQFGSHLNGERK